MAKQVLVIVGNGMAANRLVEHLVEGRANERYAIHLVSAECDFSYNRILLSPLLAAETTAAHLTVHDRDWYDEHGVVLHANQWVEQVDCAAAALRFADGRHLPYDSLVLATGSQPRQPGIPGDDARNVLAIRTLDDVAQLEQRIPHARRAVVLGGGVLGLEAAYGLRQRGLQVTLLHRASHLMNRQLDRHAAGLLQRHLEGLGIEMRLQARAKAFLGAGVSDSSDCADGIELDDGERLPADVFVYALGIEPNTALGEAAGLDVDRGIVVNDRLQTRLPNVYALGECVQCEGETFGVVAPLYRQAKVLAQRLNGDNTARYQAQVDPMQLKVTGVELFSLGAIEASPSAEALVLSDPATGLYKKLVIEQGRLVGAQLIGTLQDSRWYTDLIQQQTPIAPWRASLLFGQHFVEPAA